MSGVRSSPVENKMILFITINLARPPGAFGQSPSECDTSRLAVTLACAIVQEKRYEVLQIDHASPQEVPLG